MTELKPCPFCGGTEFKLLNNFVSLDVDKEPQIVVSLKAVSIYCENCDLIVNNFKLQTHEKLIERWNKRI